MNFYSTAFAPRGNFYKSNELLLSELLRKSKKVAEVPPKKGTKNQKPFIKMIIMQLDNIKLTVGLQKTTGDKVQYCITAI